MNDRRPGAADRRPRDVTPREDRTWVHGLLFLATLATTTVAGYLAGGTIARALSFSLTIMTILLVHEMGHFLATRHHRVPATLPYFIPAPTIIGTLGAVIRIKGAIWDRRALLDIGVAGPLAGFAVAFPALVVGFHLSRVVPVEQGGVHLTLGDSLLVILMSKLVVGTVPEGMDVLLHPVGFAGWLGMFVTSLNLLPVWQLDGGHIVKALFPEHSDRIARVVHLALVVMGGLFWLGWLLLALLLVFVGVRHPPVLLPHIALNEGRRRAGYLALAVFILTFVPAPFQVF